MDNNKCFPSFPDHSSNECLDQEGHNSLPSVYGHLGRHSGLSSPVKLESIAGEVGDGKTEKSQRHKESVDTAQALINFGPISEQFYQQAVEREKRARKFPKLDSTLQNTLEYLHSPKAPSSQRSAWSLWSRGSSEDGSLEEELENLVKQYFPYRSEVEVYVTDFKESKADTYRIKLSQIPEYWHEKPLDVHVRWLHVPIGLGPLHFTVEDLFLHGGKGSNRGRPFKNAGRLEWPYLVLEVLSFLDRDEFQKMRDIYHYCQGTSVARDLNKALNEGCWKGFPQDADSRKTGLLWDLKWRTTHLGLKPHSDEGFQPDWETLPDFWTACHTDIPLQLNEGMYGKSYGPLDGMRSKLWQSDRQALHDDGQGFFASAQLVRDPVRAFHRNDGILLTMSSMRGVNYLDRLFKTHLQEPRGAIFENDVASALAFVRKRFQNEGTKNWPQKSVEWFLTYFIAELGVTPHTDRQGHNATNLSGAYQELIQRFRRQRDHHFSKRNRREPAKLIRHMLICKDELRRILIITKRKEELFNKLVIDLQRFEDEDGKLASLNASCASQDTKGRLQSSGSPGTSNLPSALEIARDAAQRIAREIEVFDWLCEEISEVLTSVYELRSIQQREVGGITDAQNNALFILTVVLTIFVPFSALTGYMGMNLSDIRSTDWNQVHFWRNYGSIVLTVAFLFPATVLVKMLLGSRKGMGNNEGEEVGAGGESGVDAYTNAKAKKSLWLSGGLGGNDVHRKHKTKAMIGSGRRKEVQKQQGQNWYQYEDIEKR